MNAGIRAAAGVLLFANVVSAQDTSYPKAKVSFNDFKNLVAEVEPHRAQRLIDLATFLRMSKEPGVIILDTRSTFRYERIHVKGAKHLSFETTVLIYCNNNFEGNQTDFASKIAVPGTRQGKVMTAQFNAQSKPLMMSLNIPTYVNLHGYGYGNVYELDELVDVDDPRITFEGSIVEQSRALTPPRLIDHQ